MRIVMVSPTVGDAFGQERVIRQSAELLQGRKGAEVYFLGDRRMGDMPKCTGYHLIPKLSSLHSLTRRADVDKLHGEALQFLESVRPDVVHLIDQFDYRLVDALCQRYPVVLTAHTVAPTCPSSTRVINGNCVCTEKSGWSCVLNHHRYGCLGFLRDDLRRVHAVQNYMSRRKALDGVRYIIAISSYLEGLLARDGWQKEKIRLVLNPVSVPVERPAPLPNTPRNLIVCASRLVSMKGIRYLLRALKLIEREEWTLWICGDGPQREYLQGLTVDLGIANRVVFRGRTPYPETQRIIASSKLLVQPNLGPEGFGLSAAEASALGVPVVAFRVPAIDEIIFPGQNGWLATPRDFEQLAVRVHRVLVEDGFTELCRRRGPELVRERFSPEAHLEATWNVYQDCVGRDQKASQPRALGMNG